MLNEQVIADNRALIDRNRELECELAALKARLGRVQRLAGVLKVEARALETVRRHEPSDGMTEGMRGALLLAAGEIEDALDGTVGR